MLDSIKVELGPSEYYYVKHLGKGKCSITYYGYKATGTTGNPQYIDGGILDGWATAVKWKYEKHR